MSARADDIRDAEILDLQRRVESLEEKVRDLEARPHVVIENHPPAAPACPMPAYPTDLPHRPTGVRLPVGAPGWSNLPWQPFRVWY